MLFRRFRKNIYTEDAESAEGTEKRDRQECLSPSQLKIQRAGVGYAGLAGVAALDAADAEEFLAAALEVGFDRFYIGWRHDKDHADAHVERLQQFVSFDFSKHGEKFEDRRNRPGGEVDLRFNASGKNARQIAGNAAAGDVRESGNPAARDDIFERGSIAQVRFQELGSNFVSDFCDVRIRLQFGDFE